MNDLSLPEGYQRVMPYLILKDAQGFLNFMQTVFGATQKMKIMRDENHIMHAEIQIGESTIMFAESTEEYTTQNDGLFIYVNDDDETYHKAMQKCDTSVNTIYTMYYGC